MPSQLLRAPAERSPPPPSRLRAHPAGGSGATPEGSEAGDGSVLGGEDDRQHLRQELFLGHLLTLAVASGAVPPHALPSVAAQLQARACTVCEGAAAASIIRCAAGAPRLGGGQVSRPSLAPTSHPLHRLPPCRRRRA